MGKTHKGETQIRIPDDTLVLICGSQNSGKTTFTKKHFSGKRTITTDEIFEEVVNNQATVLDTMESLARRTTDIFEERVIQACKESSITVVDAAPIDFEGRQEMLRVFKGLHTNIILIVLDVKYPTLAKRPKKQVNKKKKQFGITPISDNELLLNSLIIMDQIKNNQFGYRVNDAYILSEKDIEKCEVTFE
jgi:predicted kinase